MNTIRDIFRRKPRLFRMGVGEVLVTHGTFQGCPVIGIAPTPKGAVGRPRESADEMEDHMRRHGMFIQFTTTDSAVHLLDQIKLALESAADQ